MKIRALFIINILISFGAAILIWQMLPYAHGVACGANENCEELTLLRHTASTLAPLIFVSIILFIFTKIKNKNNSIVLLFLLPSIIIGLIINAAI